MGLEGILSKRMDAIYQPGRSRTWLKAKCYREEEFVVVGFTESQAAGGLAALLLAQRSGEELAFVGKVGTGFSGSEADALRSRLREIRCVAPAVAVPRDIRPAGATWVEPRLEALVRYSGRGMEGRLRHPVYRGQLERG
jgi:bifunctional non-homologous end joining protein LigD